MALLILISVLAAAGSILFLSEVTLGVGIIGYAALFGIWARIWQSDNQHHKLMKKLTEIYPDD